MLSLKKSVFGVIVSLCMAAGFAGCTPVSRQMRIASPEPSSNPSVIPTPEVIQPRQPTSSNGKMCTLEAKICPDGSAVGRTGPNCEFAACPGDKPNLSPSPAVILKTK